MYQKLKQVIKEGDKVYIKAGAVYNGLVYDIDDYGIWIDEGAFFRGKRIVDYVSFEEITEWAIE